MCSAGKRESAEAVEGDRAENSGLNYEELLAAWISVDGEEAQFWDITPRYYMVLMSGKRKKLEREARDRVELAYTTAALSRAEKLPSLAELLGEETAVEVSDEAFVAMMEAQARNKPAKTWKEWCA